MKVSIGLTRDSFNTYPQDELEFEVSGGYVAITVTDSGEDRRLVVKRSEFIHLLKFVDIEGL